MVDLSPKISDLAICTPNNSSIKIKKALGLDEKAKLDPYLEQRQSETLCIGLSPR